MSASVGQPNKKGYAPKRQAEKGPTYAVFEEVNVLVTAFQSVNGTEESADRLIADSLPPVLNLSPTHPSRIRITAHPKSIPLTYTSGATALEKIVEVTDNKYHLVLHIGVSRDDSKAYKLERFARDGGYPEKDVQGTKEPQVEKPEYWTESGTTAKSPAHHPDVMARWKSDFEDAQLISSHDAGHYVPEYVFYSSLSYVMAITKRQSITWQHRTTVELLNIPAANDKASIEKGREIVIALIYALIDSRRQRDGDYDDHTVGGQAGWQGNGRK